MDVHDQHIFGPEVSAIEDLLRQPANHPIRVRCVYRLTGANLLNDSAPVDFTFVVRLLSSDSQTQPPEETLRFGVDI